MPEVGKRFGGVPLGVGKSLAICAWHLEYDRAQQGFPVGKPMPDGMCGPCVAENRDKVAAVAAGICRQDYAGRLVPAWDPEFHDTFKVPATPVPRKRSYEEHARVTEIARRYAAEINARLEQLAVPNGNCDGGKVPAGHVVPYVDYVIVDERDRVRPAAVSDVIWASGTWRPAPSWLGRRQPRDRDTPERSSN